MKDEEEDQEDYDDEGEDREDGDDEDFGDDEKDEVKEEKKEPPKETKTPAKPTLNIELPKERWSIHIKMESDISEDMKIVDIQQVFDSYIVVKRNFFDDLLKVIPKVRHYSVGKGIESVTGIDGEDWTKNSWLLVMAKEARGDTVFWLLFKRQQNLSGVLVAFGPDEFAKSVLDLFPSEQEARNEYLKKIMIWLTIEPAKWKAVGVYIPSWI
ncbi:MAG: hypothetical protein ACFFCS_10840 [Candidatus Hodarchaeota archaeon]